MISFIFLKLDLIISSFYFTVGLVFMVSSKNERKAFPRVFLKKEPKPEDVFLRLLGLS